MKKADIVVIGGSAAGLPAAITARRHYPDKSILLIRKEERVQIPCGIPYIYGTVGSPEANMTPDGGLTDNNIELIIDEAISIDREGKQIKMKSGEDVTYDKLILATGANPLVLPIPGLDKKNVFTIEKDITNLRNLLDEVNKAKDIVILGGGFIGVEFADEVNKGRDNNVTIVELLPHCLMLAFGEEFAIEVEGHLRDRGVNVITEVKLEEVLGDDKITGVKLSNGNDLKADLLIVGVGVRANVGLAQDAGLELDRGGIIVDSTMRTSDENIFACGDCTSKRSFFNGNPTGLKLASIASMESRIAGANLYEKKRESPGIIGVFSTAIGDATFGLAGFNEKAAKDAGFDVVTGTAEATNRHPGSMPGMAKMKIKLIFNKKDGVIIGGQIRGGPSTGEAANAISACIQKKQTADEIAMFQLGTHPAVTASPISFPLVNAAEMALKKM
jgi:NADPH-dependent 2,4-dienoyl-CoA reductase/sulfur reductase-like enzyme